MRGGSEHTWWELRTAPYQEIIIIYQEINNMVQLRTAPYQESAVMADEELSLLAKTDFSRDVRYDRICSDHLLGGQEEVKHVSRVWVLNGLLSGMLISGTCAPSDVTLDLWIICNFSLF